MGNDSLSSLKAMVKQARLFWSRRFLPHLCYVKSK